MLKNVYQNVIVKTCAVIVLLTLSLQAQNMVNVSATNREASKPAAYIFEVVFDSEVRPDSRIDITFPKAFNTQLVMMAVSEKLDGNLMASVKDNVISLSRQNASTTIAAGDTIDLKVASVINPGQMEQEWDFDVALVNDNTTIRKQNARSRVEQYTK